MSYLIRKVNYYETDRMGITHHSNYIRWMEEARVAYLKELGHGLRALEEEGVTSPVVQLDCRYKQTTTFDDEIRIDIAVARYTGARLVFSYTMRNTATEQVVFTATSTHCFTDGSGKPIAIKRRFPALDAALRQLIPKNDTV